ncbi:MAG: hypothetical protein Ct9H90mP14_3610 [Methanobacteriota archaeon]|nr:MAG: hypothetical protein Ct9H90mP14_3610 [Euryarchaeota archaeon]
MLGDRVLNGKTLVVFWDYSDDERWPGSQLGLILGNTIWRGRRKSMSCTVEEEAGSRSLALNNWLSTLWGVC